MFASKVCVNETSCCYDSTSVRQTRAKFDYKVAQLVTYGLLVTRMNMAEHERLTQYKKESTIISHTLLLIDVVTSVGNTLLIFKSCVLVNQLQISGSVAFHTVAILCVILINKSKRIVDDRHQGNKGMQTFRFPTGCFQKQRPSGYREDREKHFITTPAMICWPRLTQPGSAPYIII